MKKTYYLPLSPSLGTAQEGKFLCYHLRNCCRSQ